MPFEVRSVYAIVVECLFLLLLRCFLGSVAAKASLFVVCWFVMFGVSFFVWWLAEGVSSLLLWGADRDAMLSMGVGDSSTS